MATFPGLKAIQTSSDEADSHVLGYQTARATAGSHLLDLWNGASTAAREWAVVLGGRTRGGDGTEALPAIGFLDDTDTGLRRVGADAMALVAGGSDVLDVTTTGVAVTGTQSVSGSSALTGNVGIGIAAPTAQKFRVFNGFGDLSGTVQSGALVEARGDSAATSAIRGLQVRAVTEATTFTAATATAIYASNATKGAGSTISTQYGVYVEDQTQGGTNYALYTAGTAQSRFGGAVNVGAGGSGGISVAGTEVVTNARVLQNVTADPTAVLTENIGTAGQILKVNSGATALEYTDTVLAGSLTGTVSAGTATLANEDTDSDTVTVTGAAVGDVVVVTQSSNSNVVTRAKVTSADTVQVDRRCIDASGASLSAETLRVWVLKS